jgi:hypothetical protein
MRYPLFLNENKKKLKKKLHKTCYWSIIVKIREKKLEKKPEIIFASNAKFLLKKLSQNKLQS